LVAVGLVVAAVIFVRRIRRDGPPKWDPRATNVRELIVAGVWLFAFPSFSRSSVRSPITTLPGGCLAATTMAPARGRSWKSPCGEFFRRLSGGCGSERVTAPSP